MVKKQEKSHMAVANNYTVEEKLKHILNLFFGMNPRNKFWLLEVLLLAKRGEIVICNNEIDTDDYLLCEVDTSLLAVTGGTEKTLKDWQERGISSEYAVGRTTESIKNLLMEIDNTFTEREQGGSNIFSIKQMDPLDLMEIVRIICSLPSDWFQNGVGVFAEEVLSFIARNEGKSGGMYLQPIHVSHLIMDLLDVKDGSVYNPYAGLASYGTILSDDVEYHAQEISQLYLIARLNLLLHGKDDSRCLKGDSVYEWYDQPVDYIVSTPPFNARISDRRNDTMEADFFARAHNQARKKVAAIVSGYFCAATGGLSFSIRKTLIEKDLVETVIKLPSNLFYGTNIPAFVVLLNRNKEHKGKVKFVDASECFKKQGVINMLEESMVLSLLNSDDKHRYALVDNNIVFANGCSFIPERYIAKMLIEAEGNDNYIALQHVLMPCSRQSVELNKGVYPIVVFPFTELQFSVKSCEIVKKDVLAHVPACTIEEDCIIIDTRRQLRSIYVTVDETPAYYMPYYHAFKVDTSVLNPEYLVMQLRQPYMAKQIIVDNMVSRGVPSEFYIAKVLVPSLEEQKETVIRYKEQLLKNMGMQLNDIFEKKKADYINEVRMRKHDLVPYTRELGSIQRRMQRIIENCTDLDTLKEQLFDKLQKHSIALLKLSNLLEDLSREETFGKAEPFNLDKYFYELVINHEWRDGFNIEYSVDDDALKEYGLPNHDSSLFKKDFFAGMISIEARRTTPNKYVQLLVDIAPNDFERMVRNIIENADKHGFVDKDYEYYSIYIHLTVDTEREMYQIDFSNNGRPFPKGLDKDRYGILGEKAGENAGTGKGGYIVKQIVEHYGGDYDVFTDGDFSTVRIWLPIKNVEDNE